MLRRLLNRVMRRFQCEIVGHMDIETYEGDTGKLCFSFNCARPQIMIRSTCERCGRVEDNLFMSGMPDKAVPFTPEIAGRLLVDEFGHKKD